MNSNGLINDKYEAAERCVRWLSLRVQADASGASTSSSETDPRGKYWLGRLAPRNEIAQSALGDRAERLEPCAVGVRFLVDPEDVDQPFRVRAKFCVWHRPRGGAEWTKSDPVEFDAVISPGCDALVDGVSLRPFAQTLSTYGAGLAAEIRLEGAAHQSGNFEIVAELVNDSDHDHPLSGTVCKGRLFEARLAIEPERTADFVLEALPDSFRYDRRVPAYGINCGVRMGKDGFETIDLPEFDKRRPIFWTVDQEAPDLSFACLASDPLTSCEMLAAAHARWGDLAWDLDAVRNASVDWSEHMAIHFEKEKRGYEEEKARLKRGIELLKGDERLMQAFKLMNEAMALSTLDSEGRAKYDAWRPFQVGFLLANLGSCAGAETEIVDIVWFPTGGGKTETYLGLILTAAFYDRMRGKTTGITAWSRFPLRLLSLQQTQRFANALAAAEIVRSRYGLGGDPFGLGFLIGGTSTPNDIKDTRSVKERGQWDFEDDDMPGRLRMLKNCPFCKRDTIAMKFRRKYWRVEHRCTNEDCHWGPKEPIPIWVVDSEVWRNLPTVVVGTLDKAAGIAFQTNMRGMVAAPNGYCPEPGHGHTYAVKSGRPHGCLHPRCNAPSGALPMDPKLYGVTYRLQDELHLLRDSLGAVDAHYEALFDHFQNELSEHKPKILASSATLSGYERQSQVLYRRDARVFPQPEPKAGHGFWSGPDEKSMRRFLAVAPRGQTIEYALDRMAVSLQTAIRELHDDPARVAPTFGVDPSLAPWLVDLYGTNVIYGNTLRDLDAVERSAETQWGDIPDPPARVVSLTGRTPFEDVSSVLDQLERPDPDFAKRVHVVAASSMMSHGVDVDRLNVMTMLGLPLTTAEFIQATARVGRTWPSLVFVVHKIARERDASVYRLFPQYVDQGDRFVEPIPITGKSRRVLERTMPGLAFARILMMHQPNAGTGLWKGHQLRNYLSGVPNFGKDEIAAICGMLGYDTADTQSLMNDVESWYDRFVANVEDPANGSEWANDLGPRGKPMLSLRDVEDQVPVWGGDPQ
ncbi:MAG: DNA helicase [Defluviimonas sp.]|nr:DNA helicase [Defluviimonas sp.]